MKSLTFFARASLVAATLLLGIRPAFGQSSGGNFVMSAQVIAGGGATSSSSTLTLDGTAGQYDTGVAMGGNFTLEGGFWHGIQLIQSPFGPPLKIKLVAGPRAVISWPVTAQGWSLEQADSPASSVWTPVPAATFDTATEHTVTIPAFANIQCYRLKKAAPAQ